MAAQVLGRDLGIGLLVLAVCVAACGDGSTTEPDPDPVYELPASPDALVRTFRDAYEARRLSGLDSLLAPGFTFRFAPIDVDSFGVEPTWSREPELRSAERLFGGEEGRWPNGGVRSPIDPAFFFGSQIRALEGSEWTPGDGEGRFRRPYRASMVIQYLDGCIDVVSGVHLFEVLDMSTVGGPNGEEASGFALVYWEDDGLGGIPSLPPDPFRHVASWGYVKASFREIE